MELRLEGNRKTKASSLVDLERSLIQARSLVCGKPLVRSLLCCVRNTYGPLEESRIVNEYRLVEFLAD